MALQRSVPTRLGNLTQLEGAQKSEALILVNRNKKIPRAGRPWDRFSVPATLVTIRLLLRQIASYT